MPTPTSTTSQAAAHKKSSSYSADVRLYLILESGERIALAQACSDSVDFREARVIRGGKAVLEMRVDDEVEQWNVILSPSEQPSRRVNLRIA
jgi:hypothetical protein